MASLTTPEADRSSRVAVQDYVKAIWTVESDTSDTSDTNGAGVATGVLATRLGVSRSSVSAMVRKLEEDGLVVREPYRGVQLTQRGRSLALEIVRHHRLLETFLARALGMSWDRIHAEAEILEHHISEDLEELIDAQLGRPEFDPHGHPIPRRDGSVPDRRLTSLGDAQPGVPSVIEQVRDDSSEVLRYLEEHGLGVGAHLTVTTIEPVADTVSVTTADGTIVVLGMGLAHRIDIREDTA